MPDRYGKYSYYDTPDGKDAHKKAWYVSKNMAKLGVISGTVDAFIVSAPQTKLGVTAVYARHLGVLVGVGLAYTCGTFISTDLRKVDDQKNHVVGAVAASAVMASALSNPWAFGALGLISIPTVHTLKTFQMNGIKPFNVREQIARNDVRYPSINWHVTEMQSTDDSLRKRYEEKNEEFYRQRDSRNGTAV